jgi:hypothetical protein
MSVSNEEERENWVKALDFQVKQYNKLWHWLSDNHPMVLIEYGEYLEA